MLGGAESEQPHLVITSHCFLSQILSMARQQGGFFGSLDRAFQQVGSELNKVVDDVTHLSIVDRLKVGNVVQLQSKMCGKSLRILEDGSLDCQGGQGTSSHFRILQGSRINTIQLQNIAVPQFFIAIIRGYTVGYGRGAPDCDFVASITADGQHVMLESASEPGSHIGVLPSGQFSAPAQTTKATDVSHFKVMFVSKP